MKWAAVLDREQVNDWIVSARGAEPTPLGDRPVVDRGPVVITSAVRVFEMKFEKSGDGEWRDEVVRVAKLRIVVIVVSRVNRMLQSFVRGFGPRRRWRVVVGRVSSRVSTLVVSVRMVGVRFVSVGQRGGRGKLVGRLAVR